MKDSLLPALAALLIPFSSLAETEEINGITWSYSLSNGEATIIGVSPATGDLVCPATVGEDYPVVAIGNGAFKNSSGITSMVIPPGITYIGDNGVFQGCSSLASIVLPNTVTRIGWMAFYRCSALKTLFIPDSVIEFYIGDSVFSYSGLETLSLPVRFMGSSLGIPDSCAVSYRFSLQLDANGGIGDPVEANYVYSGENEQNRLTACPFSNGGLTFVGWAATPDGPVKWADQIPLNDDIASLAKSGDGTATLYARWSSGTYTIRFDPNGGTGTMDDAEAWIDVPCELPMASFSREGMIFTGWSLDPGTLVDYSDRMIVSNLSTAGSSVTLHAVWTDSMHGLAIGYYSDWWYTSNWRTYSWSITPEWRVSGDAAADFFLARTPLVATNTFSFGPGLESGFADSGLSYAQCVAAGLTPADSKSCNFHGGYANSSQNRFSCYLVGKIEIPSTGVYSFASCADDMIAVFIDGTNVCESLWDGIGTGSIDLAAGMHDIAVCFAEQDGGQGFSVQWKRPGDASFAQIPQCYLSHDEGTVPLSFNANGGTGAMASVESDRNFGVRIPANEFTRIGHSFAGWATTVDGEVAYADEANVRPGVEELFAKWTLNSYTVDFDSDGGSTVKPITQDFGTAITLPDSPTRTGYAFTGWEPDVPATIPPSNLTCRAQWTPTHYTVLFFANGGTGEMEDVSAIYDEEISLPQNGFVRAKHFFAGWATAADGEVVWTNGATVVNLTSVADGVATLYAVWADARIVFDASGGEGTMEPFLLFAGADQTLPRVSFTKDGHFLLGWSLTPGGEATLLNGDSTADIKVAQGETVTLYAVWHEGTGAGNGLSVKYYDISSSGYSTWTQSEESMTSYFSAYPPTIETNSLAFGETLQSGFQNNASASRYFRNYPGLWLDTVPTNRYHGPYDTNSRSNFAMLYEGGLFVDEPGTYRIAAGCDDQIVLYVDGVRVCASDKWDAPSEGSISLSSGMHRILIATYEDSGEQGMFVEWKKPGDTAWSPLPQSVLSDVNMMTYVVRFNANGGEGAMAKRVYAYGDDVTLPAMGFARDGWTFVGWATEADGPVVYSDNETIAGGIDAANGATVTLYARWALGTYSVHFNANGGTGEMEDQSLGVGIPEALISNCFSKVGYTHVGWTLDGGDETVIVDKAIVQDLAAADATVMLKAVWTANQYTIRFDANGGTGTMADETAIYDEERALPKNEFSRDGLTFVGWAATPEGAVVYTNRATVVNLTSVANGSSTLYAVWGCLVFFDANGGMVSMESKTVVFGAAYGVLPLPARSGYTFAGWMLNGTATTAEAICATPSNHVLVAIWQPNEYTVSFDTVGGAVEPSSKIVTFDAAYGGLPVPTKQGYSFAGWTLDGDAVNAATIVATPDDHTLIAIWTPNGYKVFFDAAGGEWEGDVPTNVVTYGSAYGELPVPIRTGYSHVWALDGSPVGSETTVATASDHTLVAIWTPNEYTVQFDATYGTVAPSSKTVTFDAAYGALPVPANDNHVFLGWQLNGAPVNAETMVQTATSHTLTASWSDWMIRFNANGGSGTMESQPLWLDQPASTISTNRFTREGFFFLGWALSPDGEAVLLDGDSTDEIEAEAGETVTLYAVWREGAKQDVYAIIFNANGGNFAAAEIGGNWIGRKTDVSSWTASPNNVLTGLEGTFSGTRYNEPGRVWSNDSVLRLTDGIVNATGANYNNTYAIQSGTIAWVFSKTVNLTGLRINTHWEDGGRDGIVLSSVQVRKSSGSSWETIPDSSASFGAFDDDSGSDLELVYRNADDSVFVKNVTAIRFNLGNQDNNGTGFTEFEALGYASVNLPSNSLETFKLIYVGGEDVTLPDHDTSRIGYTLAGWSRTPDGPILYPATGTLPGGAAANDGETIDLYAVWTANEYDVEFDANGGNEILQSKCGLALKYYDISSSDYSTWSASEPALTNYFASRAPTIATNTLAFGESLDPGIAGVEQSSVNQFRSWGLNDLRFEVDGTTNRFHGKYAQKAQENISAFLTGFIAVSESGTYSFACIADDYEAIFVDGVRVCRSQWSTIGSGSAELARGAHSFSMGFHEGDGGHGFAVQWKKPGDTAWSPLPQSVLFEDYPILETATFDSAYGPLPETSRTGYTFEGWTLYGETVMAETICTQPSNHVLTAKWTPNDYTVSFDATGGAVNPASKGVTFDAAYGALPTPVREPYVFVDWRLDGAMVDDATIVTTPSNHVLSARWGVSIGGGVWEETICDEPISLGAPLVAPSGEVVVPSEIDGRPVVEIGADAFAGNASITSITIPESVTNIADGAFAGCTGLKAVVIDSLRGDRFAAFLPDLAETVERVVFLDGVTAIPDDFFEGCTALRSMDIADSVVEIGTNVFEAFSALTTTVLENGLEMYQGWVLGFAGGSLGALAPPDLAIPAEYEEADGSGSRPYQVRGIAAGAFEGEFGIGTMSLPESLRFIGARAFKDCTSLESISVPEGVAKIDREAFRNCTYAQGLALPGTLREIGDGAFANASMLMGATIPDGVVSVGACAFSNCWRMLSVAIPQSVERVGDGAFADCRRVAGVTVPLHVRPMSELFPAAYASLETISISRLDLEALEHLEGLESENAIQAYIASRQMVPEAFKGCAALEGIELPPWVCNVADGAFEGCAAMDEIAFPDAVTNIGARACASMAALEAVAFPAGLVAIGEGALSNCAAVASLALPDGLRTIGARAFDGLALLARADVPGSVRAIGDGAFAGCAAIRAVAMPGDAGTVAAVFPDCYADIVSATVVAETDGAGAPLPVVMDGLFEGCAALTRVELPQDLAEIGAGAFADCAALTEIGIPAAVTNIGAAAFAGCGTLSSIALPKSLEVLEDRTFQGCASMAEIIVPESVRALGTAVFDGCTLLRSVRFVGNAPDYATADGGPYAGVPAGAKSYVANGSMGWDGIPTSRALPEYWPAGTTYEIDFWTPNRCAVSFDANYEGAGEPAEVEQVTGTSYVLPADPVRPGARFGGWWTAPENGARITASTQVTATRPHTFYAHWTMNRYYVHFDANGGSGTAEPVEMTVGTPAPLPPRPFAKVAHDFAGWATEPGGEVVYADGAQVADLAYAQNAAVTLYAVWRSRDWTLADYLDAPALSFGTAGGGEWGPDWDDAKAGGVSLRCDGLPPAAGGGTVEATLRATVVGAGTLSFWWKTSCEEMDEEYGDWFDYAAFSVDGAETAKIAGESGWRKVECAVEGAGEHGLVWAFVRDDYDEDGADWENALWVDGVEWTPAPVTLSFDSGGATEGATPAAVVKYEGYALALPGPGTLADPPRVFAGWTDGESVYAAGATYVFGSADAVLTAVWTLQTWTLAEAVDAPALVFATGGDADWAVDATAGWTNGVSAKSGSVTNSQASWIETTVSGAGTLSFRWKVLGGIYRNTPFAYAKAEVDGTPASSTHLTDGWEAQALDIVGAGPHTIRWTFLRTSARDCDGDCAWLDGVEWTPTDATTIVVEGVSIPISWLDEAAASFVAAAGGDFAAAARATAANGRDKVWECYVAGIDPTNATSRLLATIEMENGEPIVTWTPDLNEGGTKSERVYTVEGKEKLADPTWGPTNAATRFFRVKVEMP